RAQAAPAPGVTGASAAAEIARQLARAGIAHRAHRHVPVGTIEEARAHVPHLTRDLMKTVVFEVVPTARRLLVAVTADARVDYRAVAAQAGCSRRALRLVEPARVASELGFEVGGVGPFRVVPAVEVLLDVAGASLPRVLVGGGLRTLTLELAFADLARVSAASVAAVARADGTRD
ncbi:MAG: YbaK/EbsC family protein, partial [Gammaproteobacteria bacterium]